MRVLRVAGPTATVRASGEDREVRILPSIEERPVVGDVVRLRDGHGPDATLVEVLPRETVLLRGGGRETDGKPVVANADLLLVVAAVVDPPLRPRLVDRYLVAAHAGGIEPAIVLTKVDLPHDEGFLRTFMERYRGIGYAVVAGVGRDPDLSSVLEGLIDGRIAALAGHSGVGKSTITRHLTGVDREVGAVNARIGKGRHTTTDPRMIPLRDGVGAVIDTAGVRSFHLPRLDPGELAAGFPEIERAAANCRFRGCRHDGEAGCAVPGAVSPERLDSYRRLVADLAI